MSVVCLRYLTVCILGHVELRQTASHYPFLKYSPVLLDVLLVIFRLPWKPSTTVCQFWLSIQKSSSHLGTQPANCRPPPNLSGSATSLLSYSCCGIFVLLTFLSPFNLPLAALPLLPRVTIDPAKRQTAKTGPAVPSTQGGKNLSKSSALQSLSASPSFFPFPSFLPPSHHPSMFFSSLLACPHIIHFGYSFPSLFLLCHVSIQKKKSLFFLFRFPFFFFQIQEQKK